MAISVLAAGALDAASVLLDVLFTVVVGVAVVFAVDLLRRWLRTARIRQVAQRAEEPGPPMPVTSWRPRDERPVVALPAPPRTSSSAGTYGTRPVGQRFPEDTGRLL